jgi:monodechloroaminopyrrolnitrin synthase PrnB-like protein
MTGTSLLYELWALGADWFRQHDDGLVKRFIEGPAAALNQEHMQSVTASGAPPPVLLRSLDLLRDLRVAADRPDIATRHHDLAILGAALKTDLT